MVWDSNGHVALSTNRTQNRTGGAGPAERADLSPQELKRNTTFILDSVYETFSFCNVTKIHAYMEVLQFDF